MAKSLSGKKFAIQRELPVKRLVHLRYQQGDKDTIIHLCDAMTYDTTTKAPTSFWHSICGKNMDYAEHSPRDITINSATKQGTGVRFCTHCFASVEEFLSAFDTVTRYDLERRDIERRKENEKRAEQLRNWKIMCAVLGDEVAEVLASRPAVVSEHQNEFVYKIKRDGVTYKISMSISQEDK